MIALNCQEFHDQAPELALGLLAGDERAAAIDHLGRCARCRVHLDGLVQVTDRLLLLAPAVEPEIGFESRVIARLAADGAFVESPPPDAHRRRRRGPGHWPRPLLAVAAAGAVLVVVAAVSGLVAGRRSGHTSALRAQASAVNALAARTVVVWASGGRATCRLVAFPSHGSQPAWLVIHLDEPDEPPGDTGTYQVFAEPTGGGPAVLVGSISMDDGQGTLTTTIPPGTGAVHGVHITDSPNEVRYRATFASI